MTGVQTCALPILIKPFIFGGGQEQGLRSGTENVFAIKCFENASENAYERINESYEKVKRLNDVMRSLLERDIFKILSFEEASPYILAVSAIGLRGETVLHEADDNGLIIGTGSACSSNAKKRFSRVVLACGADEKTADGVLRLSFSSENTMSEIKTAAEILNNIVKNRLNIMA